MILKKKNRHISKLYKKGEPGKRNFLKNFNT